MHLPAREAVTFTFWCCCRRYKRGALFLVTLWIKKLASKSSSVVLIIFERNSSPFSCNTLLYGTIFCCSFCWFNNRRIINSKLLSMVLKGPIQLLVFFIIIICTGALNAIMERGVALVVRRQTIVVPETLNVWRRLLRLHNGNSPKGLIKIH